MPGRVEIPELTVGDGWLIARYPRVHCTYFGPHVRPGEFDAHVEQLAQDIDTRSNRERIGVLYYVPDSATINSARRRRIAQVLVERKTKLQRTTAAYAMASHSPFVRGVVTTLFWMAPPGYPYELVATPSQGLEFIGRHVNGVDTGRLAADFEGLLATHLRQAS